MIGTLGSNKIILVFLLGGIFLSRACGDITLPGDLREPRCEKRSTSEPGRINIDTYAKNYSSIKPCESRIEFYIARNTPLRSVSSSVSVSHKGKNIGKHDFQVNFTNTERALLKNSFELPAYDEYICSDLEAQLSTLNCFDASNQVIECPAIRLKTTASFDDLTLIEGSTDVCYDD